MMKEQLIELVKDRIVHLCTHWDADGVTSGALIYHLIKPYAAAVHTLSKGKPFLIELEDIIDTAEVVICTDIQPSLEILNRPNAPQIIYIDHHPIESTEKFTLSIHDPDIQSCSLLVYDKFFKGTKDPYFLFLTLLGYFGDGGKNDDIPPDLHITANEVIPELMQKKKSYYSDDYYLEIQRYTSLLNVGKRMHWDGAVPLELLKMAGSYEEIVHNINPLAQELQTYKANLREAYDQKIDLRHIGNVDVALITDPRNIQGVLAARYMNGKPIMILNQIDGEIIGSMRVPDDMDFDAGAFLDSFSGELSSYLGGGHEKAGGFTLDSDDLPVFIDMLKEKSVAE
jgi:single-stranded DNA-specific DHH superfamily exonuclease